MKKTLEEFSVKQIILYREDESLSMRQVGPADREELIELRMLDKKGITKFTAVDIACRFLAHKNAQDKLLEDVGKDNFRFAEMLDRTDQRHNVIQIHASKIWLTKVSLTPEQFQKRVREEDALLKKHKKI